ncbi:hypothetical protein [Corynebacterium efficiens YS-314]|uniref:Uncharacterized protein n=1 Tax=Corynebacterium efficiens (strain DSM 44549 / YS-314 / AJ 12310 / JCM 11189 / NBRC 100395) TaxID=196164 RepID=Q8FNW6_COREF|nr:hypothetical protein [Corynebacterium efficiens YS-314]
MLRSCWISLIPRLHSIDFSMVSGTIGGRPGGRLCTGWKVPSAPSAEGRRTATLGKRRVGVLDSHDSCDRIVIFQGFPGASPTPIPHPVFPLGVPVLKLRRASLALVTATAVALSIIPTTAVAQEDAPAAVTTTDESVDTWPGSVEGSSMLLDGELPPAPEFGSSAFGSSDSQKEEEKEEDKGGNLVNEDGEIPVIGSISLPGWLAIPIGILQVTIAVTSFMAQAAYMVLSVVPDGPEILREWLISVGINPDA